MLGVAQRRRETDIASASCGTSLAARSLLAAPIVTCSIDRPSTNARFIECADVLDANVSSQQIIEVNIDFSGRVDRNVNGFVPDLVIFDHGAVHRRRSIATVDVDSNCAWGCSIPLVGEVPRDEVADDLVTIHVIRGKAKCRTYVCMQGDATQSVAGERVMDNDVAGHGALARAIGKHACSRPSDLYTVVGG